MLREQLKELAKARRRFGYHRLHVFLRREGHEVDHKRLFRIYREEQLHVRRRGGRKRVMGTWRRWCCHCCQTNVGRWILYPTR